MKTAVLLITFNRLDYVKESLKAIAKAKPPRLYIASDGPRPDKVGEKEQVQAVRDYLLSHIDWECEVHKRFLDTNSGGCKNGVSGAVTWFFENEPKGIILEDDCVANPSFFPYCEKLLKKYRNNKKVWHIAGDAPIEIDIPETYYFAKIQHCWGWASWADRWKHFSLDLSNYGINELKKFSEHESVQRYWGDILDRLKRNEIDSWAYPWSFNIVAHDGLCINPAHNLISNIGVKGVHYSGNDKELSKKTFSINKIKHPRKVCLDKNLVDEIYIQKFGIGDIKIAKEVKPMYSYDNKGFLFRHVIYQNGRHKFYVFGIRVLSYKPRFAPGAEVKGNFLYTKEKCPNGRRHIYVCGIKVFSYSKKKKACERAVVSCVQPVVHHDVVSEGRVMYSQDGEDMCLYSYILEGKPDYKGFYVDIGALDPYRFSNTCVFYQQGWRGINIDATPGSMKKFDKERPNDINIETVVSDKSGQKVSYFIFNEPALNCFDKNRLKVVESNPNYKLLEEKVLETKTINEILDENLPKGQKIDFITIDIEGIDVAVIRSLDYKKYAPDYFIIEELDYQKDDFVNYSASPIYKFLSKKGYIVVAKTKRSVIYAKKKK